MFLLLQWSLFQLELYCLGIIISFHYDSTFGGCPRLSFPRTRSSTSLTLLAKEEIVNWTIKRNRSDMTHKSSSLIHGRTHRCTPPHTMSSIMWSITIGILSRDGHQRKQRTMMIMMSVGRSVCPRHIMMAQLHKVSVHCEMRGEPLTKQFALSRRKEDSGNGRFA